MSFSKVGLLRPILSRTMVSSVRSNLLARKVNSRIVSRVLFSTDASAKETPKSEEATQTDTKQNQLASQNYDDYDDYYDEPVTPADKVSNLNASLVEYEYVDDFFFKRFDEQQRICFGGVCLLLELDAFIFLLRKSCQVA